MKTKSKIPVYLRLLRPQSAAMTASVLLVGALVMGQRDTFLLSILFIIGVLSHIFGFVLNDYADIEVDKKSGELKDKPLVSGIISKNHALIIVILAAVIAYALTILFFPSIYVIIILTIAAILGGIYNFCGKKIPGSEFIVSAGLGAFCLFAASTVSLNFTNTIYLVSLLIFIDGVFIHVVEGGLKDADHDYLQKAKTLPAMMGIKVKDGKLLLPKTFLAFSYLLKAIYFILIILLGLQPEINIWNSNQYILQILVIFLLIMIALITYKFLHLPKFDRSKMKKLYAGLNSASLGLIFIILLPIIEIEIILILLVLPITWYVIFNAILYGKSLEPQV